MLLAVSFKLKTSVCGPRNGSCFLRLTNLVLGRFKKQFLLLSFTGCIQLFWEQEKCVLLWNTRCIYDCDCIWIFKVLNFQKWIRTHQLEAHKKSILLFPLIHYYYSCPFPLSELLPRMKILLLKANYLFDNKYALLANDVTVTFSSRIK